MTHPRLSPVRSLRPLCLGATCLVLIGAALPTAAGAQGALSEQGLGFPTGQLSSRAYGTGGAIGEMDPWSPINPATISEFTSKVLSFQLEPEYRQVTFDSSSGHTTTNRYPLVFGAVPFGNGFVASFGASTLLDRSWSTSQTAVQSIGSDTTTTVTHEGSSGAINDVRFATAWTNNTWLRLGVGVHAITGRNVISSGREFADTIHFSTYRQQQIIEYRGAALSAGAVLAAPSIGELAFSYRSGLALRALVNDSSVGKANVPDRFGASAAYTGIIGTTIAVRASHDSWSALGPLTSIGAQPKDSWDLSAGTEITGPSIGSHALVFRAGARTRMLPYAAADSSVRERSFTLGGTTLFASGRLTTDLAVIRSFRDAGLPVSERAWTFSLAFTARP